MTELAVLVPVLKRPHRVQTIIEAFASTTPDHTLYFIPDTDDCSEIEAIENAGGNILYRSPGENYATKINIGCELTSEPLIFLGADDLGPEAGWFDYAKACIEGGAQVVGINDLIPRSRFHTTHFLITRDYAQQPLITGERGPLCELYDHSCVDDELIATATKRRVYAYEERARVQHFHPDVRSAPWDPVYAKGRAKMAEDRKLWRSRHYWHIERNGHV